MNDKRGTIRNTKYAAQLNKFDGLVWGTISPTDIDGLIDFGNKVFVLIEVKRAESNEHVKVPYGQKLALQRIVDNLQKAGKHACAIVCRHYTDGDVHVANCRVAMVWMNKKWKTEGKGRTVKQFIDDYLDYVL